MEEPIDRAGMIEQLVEFLPGGMIDEVLRIVNRYVRPENYIPVSYIKEYAQHHDAVCQMNLEQLIENYKKGAAPDEC